MWLPSLSAKVGLQRPEVVTGSGTGGTYAKLSSLGGLSEGLKLHIHV